MEKPSSYCEFVGQLEKSNVHRIYHDTQYGFPIDSDNELFGRLVLEINQAGLSLTTILNKQKNFRNAYSDFNIEQIANYNEQDISRLLSDSGIIRNKLKVNAAIFNARKILEIQKEHRSFKEWLDKNQLLNLEAWIKLFRKTFKFTGGEITKEFLVSSGYIKGAHIDSCTTFNLVINQSPRWYKIESKQ